MDALTDHPMDDIFKMNLMLILVNMILTVAILCSYKVEKRKYFAFLRILKNQQKFS